MIDPTSSAPPSGARSAVPSRGQNRSSDGYSVPQVGQIFTEGAFTLQALDAEDLVPNENALAGRELAVAVHGEGDPITAAGVVNEELGVLAPDLGVATAHRRIVRKHPVAGFATDLHRARRREMKGVAHASVGAELFHHGDVGGRHHRSHAAGRIGLGRMGSRVAEPTEAKHLRADEHDGAGGEPRRAVGVAPGAFARAEIADPQLAVAYLEPGVERGEIDVVELDVGIAAADDGLSMLD